MRATLEQVEIEGRRKDWSHKDQLTEKELAIEKFSFMKKNSNNC